MNFIKISWKKLENDSILLAQKIRGTKIDGIVSISRGGMITSRLLSDLLELPVLHVTIESYLNIHQVKEPVVTQVTQKEFTAETILLVDDISDTGKTFLCALSYLHAFPIKRVYTTALYYKPKTSCIPDFSVQSLTGWIVFPYEIRETWEYVIKTYGDEEGLKKLHKLHIPHWKSH